MVNKKVAISTNNESDGDEDAIIEMCVVMDDLRHHNENLKDNELHIQQHQVGMANTLIPYP